MNFRKRNTISVYRIGGNHGTGKRETRNGKKSCVVYHNALYLDGVDGIFMDTVSAEDHRRAVFCGTHGFDVDTDRCEGSARF